MDLSRIKETRETSSLVGRMNDCNYNVITIYKLCELKVKKHIFIAR